jgi:hypothetical protein
MTNEDYHNEFVKLLVKAWSGASSISNKEFILKFNMNYNKLPTTHTCFVTMDFNKPYNTINELYKDLLKLVFEGSNFGEAFGGKKKKSK